MFSYLARDFMFQLTPEEKLEVVTNCDHLSRFRFSPGGLRCHSTAHDPARFPKTKNRLQPQGERSHLIRKRYSAGKKETKITQHDGIINFCFEADDMAL
jgi:hypothetical protein